MNKPFANLSTTCYLYLIFIEMFAPEPLRNTNLGLFHDSSRTAYLSEVALDIGGNLISLCSSCTVILSTPINIFAMDFASEFLLSVSKDLTVMSMKADDKYLLKSGGNLSLEVTLRFTPVLKVAVTVLPEEAALDRCISNLPKVLPLFTRRDEDFYFFIATNEKIVQSFVNSKLNHFIRYKTIVHPKEKTNFPLESKLYCLVCPCIYGPSPSKRNDVEKLDDLEKPKKTIESCFFRDPTRNLHTKPIRISAPTQYQPTYEMEFKNGRYRHKRGVHALMFNIVAAKINATYTLGPCRKFGGIKEGASGVLLSNGTWAGCMGDVVREVSDMALSVSPDDTRYKHVHFTSPMEYTYVDFTTAKPRQFSSWKSVFAALDGEIWILISISITLASSIIQAKSFTEKNSLRNARRWIESCIHLTGYMVGQDLPSTFLSNLSVKVVYSFWLFYGFVVGATYSCCLQAVIVSPGYAVIPKTFSQLVHSNYEIGAASGFRNGLGEQLFKHSENPIMRDIYGKMKGDRDEIECTEKALFSKYACLNWEIMERFHLMTEFADKSGHHPFQSSKETAFFTSLNFITRKRELYRSHFNDFMTRSYDTGLVKQTIARDWRKYRLVSLTSRTHMDYNKHRESRGPSAFQFENVKGSFAVLLCGLAFAAAVFMTERWITTCIGFNEVFTIYS